MIIAFCISCCCLWIIWMQYDHIKWLNSRVEHWYEQSCKYRELWQSAESEGDNE